VQKSNNDDQFHEFVVSLPDDPLEHLRGMLVSAQEEIEDASNDNVRKGYEIRIRNLKDFLELVDRASSPGSVQYIEKTNVGEESMGTGSVLLNVFKIPRTFLEIEQRETVLKAVYSDGDDRASKAYFVEMAIQGMYEWWEKGETTEEPFGTVQDDTFRGFVKI